MILRSPHRSVGHIGNRVILFCFRLAVLGHLLSGLPGYAAASASVADPSKAKRPEHWAYVRPNRPTAPEVKTASWVRGDIDRFILARLEKTGLSPNREADRYTLIRRLSLDLIGLPPSLNEVDAFVADRGPDAYERLILDCMLGDSTLFTRSDEVEAQWQIVSPITRNWDAGVGSFIEQYRAGTWGPKEANDFMQADGRKWRVL